MINGVLQRLIIVEFVDTRLILREQPLLEWVIAGVLFIVTVNLAIFQLWITAIVALVLGIFFVLQARMRVIRFDANTNAMMIEYVYLTSRTLATSKPLHEISRAYLAQADDGSTQIILVDVSGDEMGLSVYSQDVQPWKEEIVIAINTVLHEAHKNDDNPDVVV